MEIFHTQWHKLNFSKHSKGATFQFTALKNAWVPLLGSQDLGVKLKHSLAFLGQ